MIRIKSSTCNNKCKRIVLMMPLFTLSKNLDAGLLLCGIKSFTSSTTANTNIPSLRESPKHLAAPLSLLRSLQDRPPLLLSVSDRLLDLQLLVCLQVFLLTQTLRSSLQLHHLSLTVGLGAHDGLNTQSYTVS